jgi:hypothetical protein
MSINAPTGSMAASFGDCFIRGYHRLLTYYVNTVEEKMRSPEFRKITMILAEARSADDRVPARADFGEVEWPPVPITADNRIAAERAL